MKLSRCASVVLVTLALISGVEAWAKKISFETSPVGQGRIFVDGKFVGVAPVTVDLNIPKNGMTVRAEKEGALGLWPTLFDDNQKGTVLIRLEEDLAFKQTVVSDVANKWQTVQPVKKVTDDDAWKKIISIVTDNFSDLEQIDKSSFYLRTAWRVRRFAYTITRQRLVIKRGVTDDLTIRIQIESQIYHLNPTSTTGTTATAAPSPRDEDYEASDRVFSSDADIVRSLREQL